MLISENTSKAIDTLVGTMFNLNRTTDRLVSVLQNKFCMPQASDIIHENIAHLYPLLADVLTEIKDRYNMSSEYPETHGDNRDYENLQDAFETLYVENENAYKQISLVYKIANDNGDLNVMADIMRFARMFSIVMGQIYTLKDKSLQLPTDYNRFDKDIAVWGIDGVVIPKLHEEENEEDDE